MRWALFAILTAGCLTISAEANGRKITGGHPYHNGAYFIPPSSAYEAVGVRPPIWYGAPMYYYPESYLPPGGFYFPPPTYPGVPFDRAGGQYLGGYTGYYTYPY